MLTRKKAIAITRIGENLVYSSTDDIAQLIQIHAELGMDEMEVFITKESAKKLVKVLNKKGFYTRILKFAALEHECRLYISWMSNLRMTY